MTESGQTTSGSWWRTPLLHRVAKLHQGEDQVFLVLALVIGALTGLAVVAFILLTERVGLRLYPADGVPWRRLLLPVVGSLGIGYLLFSYFPDARGSGVPQTKAAMFAREGRITLRTVVGSENASPTAGVLATLGQGLTRADLERLALTVSSLCDRNGGFFAPNRRSPSGNLAS